MENFSIEALKKHTIQNNIDSRYKAPPQKKRKAPSIFPPSKQEEEEELKKKQLRDNLRNKANLNRQQIDNKRVVPDSSKNLLPPSKRRKFSVNDLEVKEGTFSLFREEEHQQKKKRDLTKEKKSKKEQDKAAIRRQNQIQRQQEQEEKKLKQTQKEKTKDQEPKDDFPYELFGGKPTNSNSKIQTIANTDMINDEIKKKLIQQERFRPTDNNFNVNRNKMNNAVNNFYKYPEKTQNVNNRYQDDYGYSSEDEETDPEKYYENNFSSEIQKMFGRKRHLDPLPTTPKSRTDTATFSFADLEEEEEYAERIAKEEDLTEIKKEKLHQFEKQKKRKK